MKQTGEQIPNIDQILGQKYNAFEQFQQKAGKMMYETDEIIIEKLENQKKAAVQVEKVQRTIEPGSKAGFRDVQSDIIDPNTFRPEQSEWFDPKAKRREYQKKFQARAEVDDELSKFEKPDDIELTTYEESLRQRLLKEVALREAT